MKHSPVTAEVSKRPPKCHVAENTMLFQQSAKERDSRNRIHHHSGMYLMTARQLARRLNPAITFNRSA